jgi:hypothetical protein
MKHANVEGVKRIGIRFFNSTFVSFSFSFLMVVILFSLFALANEKFQEALSQSPNSTSTLYHWGKMLHRMALRCYDPQRVLPHQKTPSTPQNLILIGRSRSSALLSNKSNPLNVSNNTNISKRKIPLEAANSININDNINVNPKDQQNSNFQQRPTTNSYLALSPPEQNAIDFTKAGEYFVSSEEKFSRAFQIAPNNRVLIIFLQPVISLFKMFVSIICSLSLSLQEIKEHFVILLFDYAEFLFEKAKLLSHQEAKYTTQNKKRVREKIRK